LWLTESLNPLPLGYEKPGKFLLFLFRCARAIGMELSENSPGLHGPGSRCEGHFRRSPKGVILAGYFFSRLRR
jgi:hypothetical protein